MTFLRATKNLTLALLALVSACAEISSQQGTGGPSGPLVFPAPPDEPRFQFERSIHGSADVVVDEEMNLKRMLTGEAGTSSGMSKPYGVTAYRGRIYVTDIRAVHVFDTVSNRYFKFGESDPGGLEMPFGIDHDAAGNLYVVDGPGKSVSVYDADGKFKRALAGSKWLSKPAGIAVDPEGKKVFVVDAGGVSEKENHRIRVFDAVTGEHLYDIGKRGNQPGELNLPRDAEVGPDGLLYVVDGGNFRVQVFKQDGTFVRTFGMLGKQPGSFARPKELGIDREGNVYVVDAAFGNFQIFNREGQLLMFVGDRSERDTPAKFMLPSGIAVDEQGKVYVVDQFFGKVDVFRPVVKSDGASKSPPVPSSQK